MPKGIRILTQKVKIPNVDKCAYLAGMIDGDGYIWKFSNKYNSTYYGFGVVSTDKILMDWLEVNFNCGHFEIGKDNSSRGFGRGVAKPIHRWRVTTQADVLAILTACLPYFVIKKALAEIAIDSIRSIKSTLITSKAIR